MPRSLGYVDAEICTADGGILMRDIKELTLEDGGCCPIDICNVDACGLMCNYIQLLPNGPLWDTAKSRAMERYADVSWCETTCAITDGCTSLVDYAAYSGYRLFNLLQGPLWSTLRESDPYTAVETVDSQLARYGWSNPWETICRDARLGPSPLDCVADLQYGACDANFDPVYVPALPAQLDAAVRRGILIALTRLQMRPIKNLCGINWVIEPLRAKVSPPAPNLEVGCSSTLQWTICNDGDTIESSPGLACSKQNTREIPASFTMPSLVFDPATGQCNAVGGDAITIWPAVMAAQYIAISMLPERYCREPLVRCAELN